MPILPIPPLYRIVPCTPFPCTGTVANSSVASRVKSPHKAFSSMSSHLAVNTMPAATKKCPSNSRATGRVGRGQAVPRAWSVAAVGKHMVGRRGPVGSSAPVPFSPCTHRLLYMKKIRHSLKIRPNASVGGKKKKTGSCFRENTVGAKNFSTSICYHLVVLQTFATVSQSYLFLGQADIFILHSTFLELHHPEDSSPCCYYITHSHQ